MIKMHILYYHCLQDRQYLYWTPPENMDSRDSDALTVRQIIPSVHHYWSSVPLNMETPMG